MSKNRLGTYVIIIHIKVLRILKFGVNIIHSTGLNKSLSNVFSEDWIKMGNAIDIITLNRINFFST